MAERVSDVAFTPSVKAEQAKRGSRDGYARRVEKRDWSDVVTPELAQFIAERDSFYLSTANADGQPYIQHRGGPAGFLKVLDDKRLAFADFAGNKQYVTLGNLADNPRAFIFLMDYANQRRIKIWGRAAAVKDDPNLLARLADAGYASTPERVIVFTVDAWDATYPQHIQRRFTKTDLELPLRKLHERLAALEAENAELKAHLTGRSR